jgi:enoyl-CoA hydratase
MELLVEYETDEKVSIITLNRPKKLNALSKELQLQLVDAFRKTDDDPTTCVVILRAEGRSFCVGYDIAGKDPAQEVWRHDALKWHEHLSREIAMEMMPWDMKKPVIASVQGHALGGGCELAMFCDITLAASDACFGEPEVRFSDVGPAIVMPWFIGLKKARELLYMGDFINAEDALRLGMINKVVPIDELRAATLIFAKRMTLISPEALYAAKLSINRGAEAAGFRNAMRVGLDVLAPLYAAKTQFGMKFDEIKKKDGLGSALKWRAAQFKE